MADAQIRQLRYLFNAEILLVIFRDVLLGFAHNGLDIVLGLPGPALGNPLAEMAFHDVHQR